MGGDVVLTSADANLEKDILLYRDWTLTGASLRLQTELNREENEEIR